MHKNRRSLRASSFALSLIALGGATGLQLMGCGGQEFEIEDIVPESGSAECGTQVTVSGFKFKAGMTVKLGGSPCNNLKVLNENTATCTVSAHSPGAVTVSGNDGKGKTSDLPGAFTYFDKPSGLQVWANEGGDKVPQEDIRSSCAPSALHNSAWDGSKVKIWGARNEVVSFNLVLEASKVAVPVTSVSFDTLTQTGATGTPSVIHSNAASGNGVFNWNQRPIELFYVRYLPIAGLSISAFNMQDANNPQDERHVPERFRRPWSGPLGQGTGDWTARPDHDKNYPDIAVPLELSPSFNIAADRSQSVWVDVYIPKTVNPGTYSGQAKILSNGIETTVPVELTVRSMPALPDTPTAKTMVYFGYKDQSRRYLGVDYPDSDPVLGPKLDLIRDRHFQIAHRHKISLIDDNSTWGPLWTQDRPNPVWEDRLSGNLFTSGRGYAGPGAGVGNNVYAVGVYGSWSWKTQGEAEMHTHTDAWETWFASNFPTTERFLFLADESPNYAETQQWASWLQSNLGVGKNLPAFAAGNFLDHLNQCPSLDMIAGNIAVADTATYNSAVAQVRAKPKGKVYFYNGIRPASGSFATEDDGVALRELAWGQYKKKIDRWFFWESTYYNDWQNARGHNDLFHKAQTFGQNTAFTSLGETGFRHGNGDGVLFYPGTDTVFTADSYGVDGPMASLRLKHWRRGIQDADYLAMAEAANPTETLKVLNRMVPKPMWDIGVDNPADPSYRHVDIPWSSNPDDWEQARKDLATIIEGGTP